MNKGANKDHSAGLGQIPYVTSVFLMGIIACSYLAAMPRAVNADSTNVIDSTTYILLLNPDCDWKYRDQFEYYMRTEQTPYEQYLKNEYQVICLGGVENFGDVTKYVVPPLRKSLPHDDFVFVYPSSMVIAYHDYIEEKYGIQYRYMSLGSTDVSRGIAFVNEVPSNVKHEMAHLHLCGTWHDDSGFAMDHVVRHPEAHDLLWCGS